MAFCLICGASRAISELTVIFDRGKRVQYRARVTINPIAGHLFLKRANSRNFIQAINIMDFDFRLARTLSWYNQFFVCG
jgi:hypothetical protein